MLFSHSVMSDSLWLHGLQLTKLPCLPLSHGVCSNTCALSRWGCLTISSSATLFFCLQSFPASGFFPVRQLFASGGQSIRASSISPSSEYSGLAFILLFQTPAIQVQRLIYYLPWNVRHKTCLRKRILRRDGQIERLEDGLTCERNGQFVL